MHFTADWDYTVTIDGTGYVVVPLYQSRWRQLLARLRRRPTHQVYPVQVQPPTDAEIEAGAEVQRFTVATNRTGRHEPVGRPHRPGGGIR